MNNEQHFTKITNKPPHPHAHWIKLWSDGVPIEYKAESGQWVDVIQFSVLTPSNLEYRIKPSNEPWKPEDGGTYLYINSCGEVFEKVWESSKVDEKHYENGNCFHSQDDAEATAERVKKAMKGTTDVNANVGSDIGSKDEEIKTLKEELETLKIRCDNLHKAKEQLIASHAAVDGVTLTGGEVALIKALRKVKIARIPEYRTSVLCFPSENTDTTQVWCSDTPISFLTSSLGVISKDEAIIEALKKIKSEQELNNETQKQR